LLTPPDDYLRSSKFGMRYLASLCIPGCSKPLKNQNAATPLSLTAAAGAEVQSRELLALIRSGEVSANHAARRPMRAVNS